MTAATNPDKAGQALIRYVEERFPEFTKEREKSVEKMLAVMDREEKRTYTVAPVGHSLKGSPSGRVRGILGRKRRRGL